MRAVAFDFDGVLVDSYSCLASVYYDLIYDLNIDLPYEFIMVSILELEDILDYLDVWSRINIWSDVLGIDRNKAEVLKSAYWRIRSERSRVMYDLAKIIDDLKKLGLEPYIVCGCDDSVETKLKRIESSGVMDLFKDVIVYGCNSRYRNLAEPLKDLLDMYGRVIYIDDKTRNLNRLKPLIERYRGNLILINHVFKPPFPLSLSWNEPLRVRAYKVTNLKNIVKLIRDLE